MHPIFLQKGRKKMLEVYSSNVVVPDQTAIPLNTETIEKGCTAVSSSPATIQLNKCGVYMVAVDGVASTATTVQMYKDGVAQPQAQNTGTNPSFVTFVQVNHNNNPNCCCSSPVSLQFLNSAASTYSTFNVCVSKLC